MKYAAFHDFNGLVAGYELSNNYQTCVECKKPVADILRCRSCGDAVCPACAVLGECRRCHLERVDGWAEKICQGLCKAGALDDYAPVVKL